MSKVISNANRHTILIRAGWRYDASEDRYTAPGTPQDGTARYYNADAAWLAYQAARAQISQGDARQRRPL